MATNYLHQVLREPEHNRRVIRGLTLLASVTSTALLLSLFLNAYLIVTSDVEFRFMAVNESGQLFEINASNQPQMNDTKRAGWVIEQVMESMTFSFTNWQREIPAAKDGFVDQTWFEFFALMEDMGWWGRIRDERTNLRTLTTSSPFLIDEGFIGNQQFWTYDLNLLHDWEGANGARRGQRTIARVQVVEVPHSEHPSGLSISQIDVFDGAS